MTPSDPPKATRGTSPAADLERNSILQEPGITMLTVITIMVIVTRKAIIARKQRQKQKIEIKIIRIIQLFRHFIQELQ